METLVSKPCDCSEEEKRSPENQLTKNMPTFLQWQFSTQDKEPRDQILNCKAATSKYQKYKQKVKNSSLTSEEAEALNSAIGHILEEIITLQ